MHTILPALPFRTDVRDALAGQPRPERALLSWIEHIEENDVPGCEQIADSYSLDRAIARRDLLARLDERPAGSSRLI